MPDITIKAARATIDPTYSSSRVEACLDDVDIDDIINELGEADVLDAIGKEAAIAHFDIEEVED